jgi:RimJ/RimL family protein N-acetyltransferase
MTPWARTERLWLRVCGSDDLDRVHELWASPEIREFLFDRWRISRDEAQSIIDISNRSFTERGYGIWLFRSSTTRSFLRYNTRRC